MMLRIMLVITVLTATGVQAENIRHTQFSQGADVSQGITDVDQGNVVMSQSSYYALAENEQKRIASIFNLKPEEYAQYLHYMNDTMDGYEYQHDINPNLILAMHTTDQTLYLHYLDNVVKADYAATSKMLKVSADYTRRVRALHPNVKPIMTPAMEAAVKNHLDSQDVVQLFCRPEGSVCGDLLGVIKKPVLESQGARLDLFFVGHVKRTDIVDFAKSNNISATEVMSHQITLNFGDQPFKALEQEAHQTLPLPYLIVRRNGKSIPVDLEGKNA